MATVCPCGEYTVIVPCLKGHRLQCRDCFIKSCQEAVKKGQSLTCSQCLTATGSEQDQKDALAWLGHYSLKTVEFYGDYTFFPATANRSRCSGCLERVAVVPCSKGHVELCRACFMQWYRSCQDMARRRVEDEAKAAEMNAKTGLLIKYKPLLPCPSCTFCRKGFDAEVLAEYGDSKVYRKWLFS